MTTRRRLVALTLVCSFAAGACGGDGRSPIELGVKRIALKLILADEELAVPIEPERIIRLVPVPPEILQPEVVRRTITIPPILPPCPKAPEGARPNKPTTHIIEHPPAVARYPRLNRGLIKLTGGPLAISAPWPFFSNWDVPAIEKVEERTTIGSATGSPPVVHTEFEVRKKWFGSFEQIERFRITPAALQLVQRTTKVENAEDRIFRPSSPIDFYRYGLPESTWTQGAVDTQRNTAMVREARVVGRELVDVCGELVDTIRFEVSEQMINLDTQETTGTPEGEPIVYNIATQFGGILVREDVHVLFTTSTSEGVPIVVEFDYVSTLANHEPQPLPKGPA